MMKLTNAQIGDIVHNVFSHSFDESGRLHFHRFSESQLETYAAEDEGWIIRAEASASVTFDMVTDSDHITLKLDIYPGSSHHWGSFDLYVDGVFTESCHIGDLGVKLVAFPLPAGAHRITVYFPWSLKTVVNEVLLSDGATVQPVEKKLRILAFGDSITQGYITKFTSLSYVNQMARQLDAHIVNQGIGGYYSNETTIDRSVTAYDPDVITVAYGTNDYARCDNREDFVRGTGAYIRKLASLFPDKKIVGILPIYRNDHNHRARKLYRDYSLDEAREILRGFYEECQNGYVIEETRIGHIPEMYAADYLHPNELGFTFMAQSIVQALQNIINR